MLGSARLGSGLCVSCVVSLLLSLVRCRFSPTPTGSYTICTGSSETLGGSSRRSCTYALQSRVCRLELGGRSRVRHPSPRARNRRQGGVKETVVLVPCNVLRLAVRFHSNGGGVASSTALRTAKTVNHRKRSPIAGGVAGRSSRATVVPLVQTRSTRTTVQGGRSSSACSQMRLWVEVVFVALWIFLGTRPTNAGIAPDSINTMRMQLSLLISGMGLPCTFNVTHEQPLTSDWGRLRRRWPLNF